MGYTYNLSGAVGDQWLYNRRTNSQTKKKRKNVNRDLRNGRTQEMRYRGRDKIEYEEEQL